MVRGVRMNLMKKMKRRSFVQSVAASAMAIPFLTPAVKLFSDENTSLRRELFPRNEKLIRNGLGFGIGWLDTFIDGIRGGELAVVYSPLDEVSIALLINAALYGSVKQSMKIDYVTAHCNERSYVEKALHRTSPVESEKILGTLYGPSDADRLLRIHTLVVGEPAYNGWDMYRDTLCNDPPDAILVDGIGLIERVIHKTDMARELKELALGMSVPVMVNAPIDRVMYRDENIVHPRGDFNSLADIHIGFTPRAVAKYRENNHEAGDYYFLEMKIKTKEIEGERLGYLVTRNIEYCEHYGIFD